jgi:hypothetical protein
MTELELAKLPIVPTMLVQMKNNVVVTASGTDGLVVVCFDWYPLCP